MFNEGLLIDVFAKCYEGRPWRTQYSERTFEWGVAARVEALWQET